MCTVTFMACPGGYALAMNRDEKRSRPTGLAPAPTVVAGRRVLCPSEPGGGTWVGVNDAGITLALINWYSIKTSVHGSVISRGQVAKNALGSTEAPAVTASIRSHPLDRVNPFRLIGVFPKTSAIMEWRWDLRRLTTVEHPWKTEAWHSSGFDESGAQVERRKAFDAALGQKSAGTLEWLRRLHRSHRCGKGPYSICMHREDAATVSATEVVVSNIEAEMRHINGPPCGLGSLKFEALSVQLG